MWLFRQKPKPKPLSYPSVYKAAGCIFIEGELVLAGYQPHKKSPILSGLGGQRKKNENALQTAFRETVEELYNLESVPFELVLRLQLNLIPKAFIQQDQYIAFIFDMKQLKQLLKLCRNYGLHSRIYKNMPTSLKELLFKRLPDTSAEVSHLCLFPLVDITSPETILDAAFISDLRGILDHPELRVIS